jgi:L-ascorbate metabolism protein UlaG (beta-lactamase superfamily)
VELTFYGGNCIKITTKKATVVVDDNLKQLGLKSITKEDHISLRTNPALIPEHASRFTADTPGEYESAGVVIHGVAARGHMEDEKKFGATIFTIAADDIRVAVLGHIYPELSEDQLEEIGHVDVAIIPVGNSGYTMDGIGALKVIKQIEPKVVIPTHYADKGVKYEVAQTELAEALKALAMEPSETLDKYKPKLIELGDTAKLIVLNRQ